MYVRVCEGGSCLKGWNVVSSHVMKARLDCHSGKKGIKHETKGMEKKTGIGERTDAFHLNDVTQER